MKINNTNLNIETLTYAELKNLVPETPKGKMPTPKKLEAEEVIFTEHVDGADITVLKNGYVIYTVTDDNGKPHRTVYSVHRCSRIVFPVNFSKEEREDAWDCKAIADEITYRMIDGKLTKLHIIKEDRYLDGPWWFPITFGWNHESLLMGDVKGGSCCKQDVRGSQVHGAPGSANNE